MGTDLDRRSSPPRPARARRRGDPPPGAPARGPARCRASRSSRPALERAGVVRPRRLGRRFGRRPLPLRQGLVEPEELAQDLLTPVPALLQADRRLLQTCLPDGAPEGPPPRP